MIQVDVFWSFAIGGSLASAACAAGLHKSSTGPFINEYFIYNLLFLSLAFAPSGVYLLWQKGYYYNRILIFFFSHTGWETMFYLDRSLHGIFPCLFALTNVSQGILGFYLVYKAVQANRNFLAGILVIVKVEGSVALWAVNYVIMFGILGFGYQRFMYAGRENS
jgi:hypothetical protein